VDVRTAIHTLRAARDFSERPLERATLERIVDAGRWAPSSKNEQRWAFVVCTEREHLRALATVGDYAGHLAGAAAAAALVVPGADEGWRRVSIAFDLGQCAQNMMLAAWEEGVGAVHAAVYDQELARRLLGYPDGHRCDYLLSLGYPADAERLRRPRSGRGRRPLEELVHWERWGGAGR
jgi:nitroreductase